MPHHPKGDQKLLQLEALLDTDQGFQNSTEEMLYLFYISACVWVLRTANAC